jgi:hypothetical protein
MIFASGVGLMVSKLDIDVFQHLQPDGGAMVAYKGKFHVLKQGSSFSTIDFTGVI